MQTTKSNSSNHLPARPHSNHPPPQREDAQPNETSSWLPIRLRRPVEPPTIRPAATTTTTNTNTTNPNSSHSKSHSHSHSNSYSNSYSNSQYRNHSTSYPSTSNCSNTRTSSYDQPSYDSNYSRSRYHYRSSSYYRSSSSYYPSRDSSSYRPSRLVDHHDNSRLRRHSAYERHESSSSSNPHFSYRSNLAVDRHGNSSSSNFPPLPELSDSNSERNLQPTPKRSETCFTQPPNNCNPPDAVTDLIAPDVPDYDSSPRKSRSARRNTPYPSSDRQDLQQPHKPSSPPPSTHKLMRRTHSAEPSDAERVPPNYYIHPDRDPPRVSPPPPPAAPAPLPPAPSPRFKENQDEAPAFKKIKTSHAQNRSSQHHSPAPDLVDQSKRRSSSKESPPASPQETRAPSPPARRRKRKLDVVSQPPHTSTVFARSVLHPSSTREGVINLMRNTLEHFGTISDVQIDSFVPSKKCIQVTIAVTFQDIQSALKARWTRFFPVQSPFLYKSNPIFVDPKLDPAEKQRCVDLFGSKSSLKKKHKNSAGSLGQDPIDHDRRDDSLACAENKPEDQISEAPREPDVDMLSNSNENNRDEIDPLESRCSSQSNTRSSSPVGVIDPTSNNALETLCEPIGPLVLAEGYGGSRQSLNPQVSGAPQDPDTLHLSTMEQEIPPTLSSHSQRSIVANAIFQRNLTFRRAAKLIEESLAAAGEIENIELGKFHQKKNGAYLTCIVTFREARVAEQATRQGRFLFSSAYRGRGNRLVVAPNTTTTQQEGTPSDRVSQSAAGRADQQASQLSDELPLWITGKSGVTDTGSGCPPHVPDAVINVETDKRDHEIIELASANFGTSPSPDVSHSELWIKGHFSPDLKSKTAEKFLKNLLRPFGEVLAVKNYRKGGIMDVHITLRDSNAAQQALNSLHGTVLPETLAHPKRNPHYLYVSLNRCTGVQHLHRLQDHKKSLLPATNPSVQELPQERDASPQRPSPPPAEPCAASDACTRSPRRPSPLLVDVNEHSNTSHDATDSRNQADLPSISIFNSQNDHDHEIKQLEPVPSQLGLPLRVVKYPIPPTCQESHPSYISNRLRFKLEKIRELGSLEETVLDSSWDLEHLILQVVPKSGDSLPFQIQPPAEFNPSEIKSSDSPTHPQVPLLDNTVEEPSDSCQNLSVQPPANVLDQTYVSTTSIKKHRTWPFDPLPMHLDQSSFPDFPKTLMDFLTTFLRLWEESRSDLRSLYDESAVFSNILAKQGRKPLAITKSTGWPSIYKSISRLPALSNEPISDLIVDACPTSLNPPRVVCSIHGSFSEFPKNIKRAFDRTLILRPVDTHLHPSEGCLGLLKWIALSDTLTIRKHSTRTEAIVEGFVQKRTALAYAPSGSEADVVQPNSRDNRRTPQLSVPDTDVVPAGSSSLRPLTRSPTRVSSPPQKVEMSAYREDDPINHSMKTNRYDPRAQSAAVTSENVGQSAGDLALMQSQLRAMQAEIQHLKSLSQKPAQSTPPVEDVSKSQSSNMARKDGFKVTNSTSCSHVGFGVSSKRLLLPTNLSRYLVVSMRGDILTWDHSRPDNSSQVQLILSGASPTDIVDAACYSNASQTLVVGSRVSKTAKNSANCSVRLVKLQKSSSSDKLLSQRIELEDPYHENGVRALALSPNVMEETSCTTSFLTAGQEKFISLWKITYPNHSSSNSLKKIKHYQRDVVKIHTDHTSVIQALAVDPHRHWVLSGGQDGKVYVTDLSQSNHQTLFSEEKNHILDIQMNPIVQETVMVTTGNKAPGSQFRYCDLRMSKPVISFG